MIYNKEPKGLRAPSPMDVQSPPHYRRLSISRQGQVFPSGMELPPSYTRRRNTVAQPAAPREPVEHVFQLMDNRSKPWASLKLRSSAKSAKSLPTFFEKENINGSLDLNIERNESIHAITIEVTGRIITGTLTDDSLTFLHITVPIWTKTGGSRLPSPSEGANGARLIGACYWPFSIPLPKTVTIDSQNYRLPETFLERHTRASIQYDILVQISRGKLRADSRIKTAFGYVPSNRPEPPSLLRQMAYQQHTPLPGPAVDPEGWQNLQTVPIYGTVFKTRRVDIKCYLSLASPLSYTRGSVVPCVMVLESHDADAQALDILSTPTSIQLKLRRRVRFYESSISSKRNVAWSDSTEECGSTVWWQSGECHSTPTTRHLEGEIRLGKDLRPTTRIGHFSVTYTVELDQFDGVGFSPANSGVLLSQPIEICTSYPNRSPRPLAYSPPSYDTSRPSNDDYYATCANYRCAAYR